jgi:hypothetical protein
MGIYYRDDIESTPNRSLAQKAKRASTAAVIALTMGMAVVTGTAILPHAASAIPVTGTFDGTKRSAACRH